MDASLDVVDYAQLATAAFTAVAALAALFTVIRAERDRWDSRFPEFVVESLRDRTNNEARLTIVNYGGPAREVVIAGVEGEYGYAGLIPPSGHWRPGESRTVRLALPAAYAPEEIHVVVIARDLRKRYTLAATVGGARKRWRLHPWRRMSTERVFRRLFPNQRGPLDVPKTPVHMDLVQRDW